MAEQDSPLSTAANIIGILTFIFAVLGALYARWLWLAERISPVHVLDVVRTLGSHYLETKRIANSSVLKRSGSLQSHLMHVYSTEIEIARLLMQSSRARRRIRLWRKLQELVSTKQAQVEVLRNDYYGARLEAMSSELAQISDKLDGLQHYLQDKRNDDARPTFSGALTEGRGHPESTLQDPTAETSVVPPAILWDPADLWRNALTPAQSSLDYRKSEELGRIAKTRIDLLTASQSSAAEIWSQSQSRWLMRAT